MGHKQRKLGSSKESDPTDTWANMSDDMLVDTLPMHPWITTGTFIKILTCTFSNCFVCFVEQPCLFIYFVCVLSASLSLVIARSIWQGQGLRFSHKTKRLRLIICFLYGFMHWFHRPVISLWALREYNALQLANQGVHKCWLQTQAIQCIITI